MSHERPTPSPQPDLETRLGFTKRERLNHRVSEERFRALIEDEHTVIHSVELSANNYGEFLFLTVSLPEQAKQPVGERSSVVTFWGLGYHEYRERWLTAEWFWYEAFSCPEFVERNVDKATARQILEEQRVRIRSDGDHLPQSKRGKWFEMLADLTDEDGALAELEDLGDMTDWLSGDDLE